MPHMHTQISSEPQLRSSTCMSNRGTPKTYAKERKKRKDSKVGSSTSDLSRSAQFLKALQEEALAKNPLEEANT